MSGPLWGHRKRALSRVREQGTLVGFCHRQRKSSRAAAQTPGGPLTVVELLRRGCHGGRRERRRPHSRTGNKDDEANVPSHCSWSVSQVGQGPRRRPEDGKQRVLKMVRSSVACQLVNWRAGSCSARGGLANPGMQAQELPMTLARGIKREIRGPISAHTPRAHCWARGLILCAEAGAAVCSSCLIARWRKITNCIGDGATAQEATSSVLHAQPVTPAPVTLTSPQPFRRSEGPRLGAKGTRPSEVATVCGPESRVASPAMRQGPGAGSMSPPGPVPRRVLPHATARA